MTRETILIILGLVVALSPWSGLPLAWLSYGLVLVGLCIILIGSTLRARRMVELVTPTPPPPSVPPVSAPTASVQEVHPMQRVEETVAQPETIPSPTPAPKPDSALVPPSRRSRIAKF